MKARTSTNSIEDTNPSLKLAAMQTNKRNKNR